MSQYDNFYEGLNDNRNMLYRQIDTVSIMNKLLSTICSEIHNLKNYKANIKGENSIFIKEKLKDIINELLIYDEKIEEIIKIKNGFPIYQLNDIENISLIKTLASMDYKISTVINNLVNEFNILKKLIKETIENASKEHDHYSIDTLSNLMHKVNVVLLEYQL